MKTLKPQIKTTQRHSAVLLALYCLVWFGVRAEPNVLLILVDDLGYGDLSSYGAEDMATPSIDSLVKGGVRMNQFYANCPVCSPTRASLLTGRYPERAGVPGVIRTHQANSWGYLDPDLPTLPRMMRMAGYETAMFGKWHLGLESPNTPLERGFDLFKGWLGDMMDDYYTHLRHGLNYMRDGDRPIRPEGHATELFTDWTIQFLNDRPEGAAPFFIYLAYNAPHTPIQPPDDWMQKVLRREPGIDPKRARLIALIEHMDHHIGRVLKTLQNLGLHENTLIIFTSDNGGQLNVGARNGRLRDGKGSMYEGGLKVPFCAYWPGVIPSGSISEERAMTMDIMPSLCELADVQVPAVLDGVSLLGLFKDPQARLSDRPLFWVRREGGNAYQGLTIRAVRNGDWKLVQNTPFAPLELYHLTQDPLEQNDLAQTDRVAFNQMSRLFRMDVQAGGRVSWMNP